MSSRVQGVVLWVDLSISTAREVYEERVSNGRRVKYAAYGLGLMRLTPVAGDSASVHNGAPDIILGELWVVQIIVSLLSAQHGNMITYRGFTCPTPVLVCLLKIRLRCLR